MEDGLDSGEHSSVERVVQIIKDASLSWKGHLKTVPDVKFNYEVCKMILLTIVLINTQLS